MSDESVDIGITADASGLIEAFQRARSEVSESASDINEKLESIVETGKTLAEIAGFSISFEGLKNFAETLGEIERQALETSESMMNLTQTLGASVETLQTISYAANLVGGNMDTATASFARLERAAAQANTGNKQLLADFQAIGISATQLGDLIQHPDQMLQVVTQHLAEYDDGLNKVDVEMALMGRGAKDMVPLINELGENWKGLNEQALKFAGVSETDIIAMANAQREINQVNQEVAGLRAEFAVQLLPATEAVTKAVKEFAEDSTTKAAIHDIGDMVKYVVDNFSSLKTTFLTGGLGGVIAQTFTEGTQAGINFKNTILIAWAEIERDAKIAWAGVAQASQIAMVGIEHYLATIAEGSEFAALMTGQIALAKQLDESAQKWKAATVNTDENRKSIAAANDAYNDYVAGLKVVVGTQQSNVTVMDTMTVTAENFRKKTLELPEALDKEKQKLDEVKDSAAELLDKLEGFGDKGALAQATNDYIANIDHVISKYNELIRAGDDETDALNFLTQALDAADTAYQRQSDDIAKSVDITDQLNAKFQQEVDSLKNVTQEQEVERTYLKYLAEEQAKVTAAYGQGAQVTDEMKQKLHDLAQAHTEEIDNLKASEAAMKDWMGIAQNAFDSAFQTINKDIIEGGDVMKDLTNVAKQVVEQIIFEFEKLAIINPILNQLFGLSGSSALPTASFGSIINNIGGMFGGGGGGLFSGNDTVNGWMNSATSWLFGSGASTSLEAGAGVGALSDLGALGEAGGGNAALDLGMTDWGSIAGGTSSIGDASGAGLLGNGGLSGAMGTVGPMLGAFGLGERLGGGGTGGAMAGIGLAAAAYFVPVIGWIAGALTLLDTLSGGNVFGTPKQPWGSSQEMDISSSGASVIDMEQWKKKGALFSGNSYSWSNVAPDKQQTDAATAFYTSLVQEMGQFGGTAADIVSGSFKQEFDKSGKVTGSTTTIGGQTYSGETSQQFSERVEAGSLINALDDMGVHISKFVSGVQSDADKFDATVKDWANTTLQAQANLANGLKFMALSADQTLPEVMTFVQGLQKSGESISQTYQRLAQAQAGYDQFVGQFDPKNIVTYVDPFEASMSQLYASMLAAQKQANDLAKAAGASGAETSDLINIQHSYAEQMAQLTAQLEASAQSLAFSLGVSNQGSLDQVNQEISALESQQKAAESATSSFSSAMTRTANAANAATNLLLGNLSPLNDQEKLKVALQGLHSGSVTADQVLQIGRSLYASSEAYTQLFNEVLPYANRHHGGTTSSMSGHSSSSASWTGADQTRLDELKKEQATLQDAAKYQQFQLLAQQIAEIAMAKKEDFTDVMKEMGIDQNALEKGLKLDSDTALSSFIQNIEQQTDSQQQNTTSIVDAIGNSAQQIVDAITGKTGATGYTPPNTSTPAAAATSTSTGTTATSGTSYNQNPAGFGTREHAAAVGMAVGQAIGPYFERALAGKPRSSRVTSRV